MGAPGTDGVAQTQLQEELSERSQQALFCHICKASTTSRRKFCFCSRCHDGVCKPCLENTGAYWSSVIKLTCWVCLKCQGICPCKKCYQSSSSAALRKRTRREYSSPNRSISPKIPPGIPLEQPNTEKPAPKKTKLTETKLTETTKTDKQLPDQRTIDDLEYVRKLVKENNICIEYLAKTEKLLVIIQEEQRNLETDLLCLRRSTGVETITEEKIDNENPNEQE